MKSITELFPVTLKNKKSHNWLFFYELCDLSLTSNRAAIPPIANRMAITIPAWCIP